MKELFVLLAICAFAGCEPNADIVVSPDGEVRTIEAAVSKARQMRANGEIPADRAIEVLVAPGRYHVKDTIVLSPADSGLHFTGLGWDSTVVDGGVEIGTFKEGVGGVWEVDVPKGLEFEQLWVNDRRAIRARTPNDGMFFYMKEQDYQAPMGTFFASLDDVAEFDGMSSNELSKVMVALWQSWDMGYTAVSSINTLTGKVETKRNSGRPLFFWNKTCPRYVFENYRGALDAPGEWFLDASVSKLYYIPRQGETIENTRAYVPVVETILKVSGNADKGELVKDVSFDGIGFEFSKLQIGPDGIPNCQSAFNVKTAAVIAEGADGLVFRNCRIAHSGAHGIWIRGGSVRSSIEHSLIEDLGAGGVYFGDGKRELERLELNSSFLDLRDSIVRHGGRILNGAVGVWLGQVNDCNVVHNEIADFLYTGVSMGWNWGYMKTTTRRNHVDFNHIHHIQQGRLSDGGAFYSLGNQEGSTVCNNWIHDVNGYRDNGSPAWGLYTDEGSANILLASNLVERCRSGAIHQHYGADNVYANNILVTFDEYGVWRSRDEDHVTIKVMNNIFWWKNPLAGTYTGGGKNGANKNLPADGNIYWCADGTIKNDAFKRDTWENWRKGGMDKNGAIADPLFVDPENGDWTLKPESPALKAGFKPFDWKQAGVLKDDPKWVAKAAECTWDEFKDAAKAPAYCSEYAEVDFERLGKGVIRNTMGSLSPLHDNQGKSGSMEIVDGDVAHGKRALRFIEVPGLSASFQPMVNLACRIMDGVAHIHFSIRGEKGCNVSIETRDYDVDHNFATGTSMRLQNEKFTAFGKLVSEVPNGVWADVDVAMVMSGANKGEWSCTVTPRGMESKTVKIASFSDKRFARLTWIGFISYGPEGSAWSLDNVKLRKEVLPSDPQSPNVPVPTGIGVKNNHTARHIQRTMAKLASSTEGNPSYVRMLFYGQSIVGQQWHKILMENLKKKYPTVQFDVENRAIGGFTSENLIRTAENDLYPFYPDILFFHVYGPMDKYEQIIRNVRERTSAEIVLWTSHLRVGEDPRKMLANRDERSVKIADIARKYGCMLIDLNVKWCNMLINNGWSVQDVLGDTIHMKSPQTGWPSLNYYAGFIGEDLCRIEGAPDEPEVSGTIVTIPFKEEIEFEGNRVVAIMDGTVGDPVSVTLDGKDLSQFWDMFAVTRPSRLLSWMPMIKRVDRKPEARPVAESWKLTYLDGTEPFGPIHYKVEGSVTGADGEGWSNKDFVSNSGRAIIKADDFHVWQYDYFVKKPGKKNLEAKSGDVITWETYPLYNDLFKPGTTGDRVVLIQNCANGKHKLRLSAKNGVKGIKEFVVYKPAK